jgi:ABC-type uncharacterized transport system involved in gliding motility auxiliary subunit
MRQSTVLLLASLFALFAAGSAAFLASEAVWVWAVFLGLGIVGIVSWAVIELVALKQFFAKRTTHEGLNALFSVVIAIVLAVVVNLIAREYDWKKDFTKNRFHSLSEQTERVVKGLQQEVRLKAFVNPVASGEYQRAIDRYTYLSPKLKFSFIDIDRDPFASRRYDIKELNTLIVETDSRMEKIVAPTDDPKFEEKVTNAIIAVTKGNKKTVCFVAGHKEAVLSDSSPEGLSELKEKLEVGRYRTQEIFLATEGIPSACEVVVMPGPRSELNDNELATLEKHVKGGGKVFIMVEPESSGKLKGFLGKFGLDWKVGQTIVEMDPRLRPHRGSPEFPFVISYDTTSEITKRFQGQPTLLSFPTPIEKAATVPSELMVTSLFTSSANSFEIPVARLLKLNGPLEVKGLRRGPISLAATVTGKAQSADTVAKSDAKSEAKSEKKGDEAAKEQNDPEFRLVVVGDANFATNALVRNVLNIDLFENILSWLAKEEDLIAIRPKETNASELRVSEFNSRVISWVSVVFAPLGMFMMGLGVWLRRRRM